jgi:hypothetical protein
VPIKTLHCSEGAIENGDINSILLLQNGQPPNMGKNIFITKLIVVVKVFMSWLFTSSDPALLAEYSAK